MYIARPLLILLMSFAASVAAVTASAQDKKYGPGVSDTEILLGQTMPYSGPASAYGQFGRAEQAYFDKINAEGGINGRKIRMISLDDAFSPPKTVEQMRKLVEQENVFATIGTQGTGGNSAIHRYLNQRKVPHLFIVSGLERWNDPKNYPWTVAFLPTYMSEGRIYARYILSEIKEPRIAVLYQNDDAGKESLRGVREVLGEKAKKLIVSEASYEVSDPTVDSQILKLAASKANVFLNFTSPKAASQAIRKMDDIAWKPLHILVNVSANVASTFRPAGVEKSVGIVSAAYYKDPNDKRWVDDAGYKEWLEWMKKYNASANIADPFNVVGYTLAQIAVHVLRRCGDNLTRENLLKQATTINELELPMLLPGIKVNTTPDDYRMIDQMQLQRFNGQGWELFGPVIKGNKG